MHLAPSAQHVRGSFVITVIQPPTGSCKVALSAGWTCSTEKQTRSTERRRHPPHRSDHENVIAQARRSFTITMPIGCSCKDERGAHAVTVSCRSIPSPLLRHSFLLLARLRRRRAAHSLVSSRLLASQVRHHEYSAHREAKVGSFRPLLPPILSYALVHRVLVPTNTDTLRLIPRLSCPSKPHITQ